MKEVSNETREKMRKAHKGKQVSDLTRLKMSLAQTGKKLTPEHKENIRQGLLRRHALLKTAAAMIDQIADNARWLKKHSNIDTLSAVKVGIIQNEDELKALFKQNADKLPQMIAAELEKEMKEDDE